MLAVQPSAVVVMVGAVLPVDWVKMTPPAPIVEEYLTESAKYASSAVQVTQVGLHRGEVRLFLRVGELRDRDRGQDADDHDHDQQLDERETLAIHVAPSLSRCFPASLAMSRGGRHQATPVARPRRVAGACGNLSHRGSN